MARGRTLISLAVVTATSFGLAACGGDDDSSAPSADAAPFVAAAAAALEADPEMAMNQEQAECFAGRMVNILGVDKLEAAGVTPDSMALDVFGDEGTPFDISESQADDLATLLLDGECISFVDMMMGDPEASEDMTEEQASCMADAFTGSDTIRAVAVANLLGEEIDDATGMAMFGEMLMMMGTCGLEM